MRAVEEWNSLSIEVPNASSIDYFKEKLYLYWIPYRLKESSLKIIRTFFSLTKKVDLNEIEIYATFQK